MPFTSAEQGTAMQKAVLFTHLEECILSPSSGGTYKNRMMDDVQKHNI
jgi:hypothetical protein